LPVTYLQVTYAQRETVKSLGARWDAAAKKWFVPEGRDLGPFDAWLPADARASPLTASSALTVPQTALVPAVARGKRLSEILAGVAGVVANAYPSSTWVMVDVAEATVRNHVYLDLAERDEQGVLIARARGVIWAREAREILPKFEAATGMSIGPGIKLLVRARPTFNGQYGFSLSIDAIDPDYTLGDLEARKREIKAKIQSEGLWDRNRALDKPWDFNDVLVVAPPSAAGLGDFKAEASRIELAGLCRFTYAQSRFQGEGAAAEIVEETRKALELWQGSSAPDVVVFIRGGGAVNELAWLNDYELAKFVCLLPVPVFTGIGHERDTTVLDEVAHTCFDTPSKVIFGIEAVIAMRAREARASFDQIAGLARRSLVDLARESDMHHSDILFAAGRFSQQALLASEAAMTDVRVRAMRTLRSAAEGAREAMLGVQARSATQVALARQLLPAMIGRVRDETRSQIESASRSAKQRLALVLERANSDVASANAATGQQLSDFSHGALQAIRDAKTSTESLMREVAGQGPEKTLARGFAHVRDDRGHTVMSATQLEPGAAMEVTFRDGSVPARVEIKESKA
jgi:exodeoxyribonuclease VII large subunit